MTIQPHSFIRKDAGDIKEWWKQRILSLIDANEEQAARSLYDEFHLGEQPKLPERY